MSTAQATFSASLHVNGRSVDAAWLSPSPRNPGQFAAVAIPVSRLHTAAKTPRLRANLLRMVVGQVWAGSVRDMELRSRISFLINNTHGSSADRTEPDDNGPGPAGR